MGKAIFKNSVKMFSEEYLYKAKGFLRSIKYSYATIEESADNRSEVNQFENSFNRILDAEKAGFIKVSAGEIETTSKFDQLREYKLFQFSKSLLDNYLPNFNNAQDYKSVRDTLQKGISNLQK